MNKVANWSLATALFMWPFAAINEIFGYDVLLKLMILIGLVIASSLLLVVVLAWVTWLIRLITGELNVRPRIYSRTN